VLQLDSLETNLFVLKGKSELGQRKGLMPKGEKLRRPNQMDQQTTCEFPTTCEFKKL
jgi:hypothetical protein